MALTGARGRRHLLLAPYLALVLVVTGVVFYAVTAQGYQAHETELNDGGVWVTSSSDGFYGRVNKPIGQLDGAVFARLESSLDIVQDGAAVVGWDVSAGLISTIDPAGVRVPPGEDASVPTGADVELAGGSLAVLDPETGKVWTQRADPRLGLPVVSSLDQEAPPRVEAGADAALAVTTRGTVLVASGAEDTLTALTARTHDHVAGRPEPLPDDVGTTVALTAVGETPVVLDADSGALLVPDGARTSVAPDAVLQQPGLRADGVLLAGSDRLQVVDTATGTAETIVDGVAGRPAAPVRLGDCVYGAWAGGRGTVATVCRGSEPAVASLGPGTSDLVFRVNRGEIILNDRVTGAVWEIESEQPTRLDQWDAFQERRTKDDDDEEKDEEQDQGDRRPPKAEPDDLGARPGRTTVLHPLDNDTAPVGRILSIRSVQDVRGSDAEVTISPDGQTVQVRLPDGAGTTTFEYTVDDGRRDVSAHATVTVRPRQDAENAAPALREGFEPRLWTVPAGGTLDVPVLGDWRDREDGDPLTLDSAVAEGSERTGAVARSTASGRVRFSAPAEGGPVTVRYAVTDGIGEPVEEVLRFRVQDRRDRQSFPATAEPDVVSGEAGEPITIRPLANDLPGSDPVTPEAALAIAGKVAPTGGATVTTDLVEGTVTFRSTVPRTYFLDYDAAYGNADLDDGRIRVDVRAPERPPLSPVAMPDNVTLHGQASALVDVLANDLDPAGGLLVVQRAIPAADNQLDVAVVDGRWVRLSARQGQLGPNPQLVRYTISNGEKSGVQGEIVVSQRPPPDDDTPVTETDRVTVRAGSGVSVAVLDNDFSPSGDALRLVGNVAGQPAGQLAVQRPGDERVPTGTAYVAGRFVRYVAPADLQDAQAFTVQYVATNSRGESAPGRVEVTVIPRTRPNEAPEPPGLEGRVVSGDTVRLRLPGAGLDPDGDPVTLTGLGSAPALGRVVRVGASSLEYRAFPASIGTDEFAYTVTDPSGGTASGTVRVAVVPPGPSQPPLAVPDTATVEPGRRVLVDVMANDHLSTGDRGVLTLVDPPSGASLESETGPLVLQSPPTADGRDLEVVYRLDNGLSTSQAVVTLRTVRPWNNPPVVFDAFGQAAGGVPAGGAADDGGADDGGAGSVTVDVLETAYDPDGPTAGLRVVEVAAPPGSAASTDGRRVTVQQGEEPLVVPFRVEDADGGAATASLYVPALRGAAPYVDPDALIRLEPGESVTARLPDLVVDPAGGPVRFTLKDRISAAPPTGLVAAVTGEDVFEVRAGERASGPGAVSFEVTTGTSVDDPDGVRVVLSVPVQVGEEVPVLRCPTDPVPVAQGQTIELDVTSLCHVWTPDPEALAGLQYAADWTRSSAGLSIIDPEGRTVSVAADGAAEPGTAGVLTVTAPGSLPGLIPIEVVDVPPPSLAPIRVADMRAGETRTLDLARYLRPGVADPEPTVVAVEQLSGLDVDAAADGSSITLRTGPEVAGRAQLRVVMSDVAGDPPPGRRVEGRITLEVLDRPDTPSAPVPGRTVRSGEARLQWTRPEANGSPIDVYEVRAPGAGSRRCPTTTCEVTGLVNGRAYAFQVRAHNAVGWSGWSASSAAVTPDAKPGIVGPVRLVRVGDRTMTLRWSPPTTRTSRIRRYFVTWPGGTRTTTTPSIVIGGLTNGNRYVFSVQAENELDVGPARRSAPYQSVGTPGAPQAPQVTDQETAGDQGAVTLSWAPVDPNGPDPVRYTVLRNGSALPGCTDLLATRCDDSGITYDGATYTYAVRATNQGVDAPGGAPRSATGPTSSWSAVGQPEAWGDWSVRPTGSDARAVADFTVPDSRGARSTVRIFVNDVQVDELQATGRVSRAVGVPHNDGPHAVRLRVCNEAQACSDSATRTVQTYGPLNDGHVLRIEPRPDGTRLSWTVTVDSNGDPATVRVTSTQGRDQTFAANGVDVQSFSTSSRDLGYSATEQLTVTISDSSPRRGPGTRRASYTTGAAPTPTVAVSKGASCGPGSGNGPCNSSASSPTECNNSSCGRIVITTARWSSATLSCSLDSTHGNSGWNNPYTVTANTSDQLGAWFGYPDGRVRATCTGDDLGGARRTVTSPWYDWPG